MFGGKGGYWWVETLVREVVGLPLKGKPKIIEDRRNECKIRDKRLPFSLNLYPKDSLSKIDVGQFCRE